MIEPHKPLIDSGLAAFLFSDSTKTATNVYENARFLRRAGQNKLLIISRHHDDSAKVGILFETTKKSRISTAQSLWSVQGLH